MGNRKYLPIRPKRIRAVLVNHSFSLKRTKGDHEQWEGVVNGERKIVTVPNYSELKDPDLIKSIIRQSGLSRDDFYE
jgi:Predicted periplasmic or secreted lipoprotein